MKELNPVVKLGTNLVVMWCIIMFPQSNRTATDKNEP